jgi:dihydrofolate reductase
MRKIIISMHVSLDGYAAGPKGEMDWIHIDEEMFDFVGKLTDQADTALYGRVTYEIMDAYWPTAAEQPNPSKHDIEHSNWYKKVDKVVLSRTMQRKDKPKTRFIGGDPEQEIRDLKQQQGKDILIFGSPSVVRLLMEYNLIDEYWLFVNPVILGKGIPVFGGLRERINLKPVSTKVFSCGVTALAFVAAK